VRVVQAEGCLPQLKETCVTQVVGWGWGLGVGGWGLGFGVWGLGFGVVGRDLAGLEMEEHHGQTAGDEV